MSNPQFLKPLSNFIVEFGVHEIVAFVFDSLSAWTKALIALVLLGLGYWIWIRKGVPEKPLWVKFGGKIFKVHRLPGAVVVAQTDTTKPQPRRPPRRPRRR